MSGKNETEVAPIPTLERIGDQLYARVADAEKPVAVKVVWMRPVSGRGREISIVGPDKKELAMIEDLTAVEPATRALLTAALAERYGIATVLRIERAWVQYGNRYWDVVTDRGPRNFLIRDPGRNVIWLSPDHVVLKDVAGNRFEVPSVSGLDARSRAYIESML